MKVNFLTTTNENNGYGMVREYLLKYAPQANLELDSAKGDSDITLILHIPPAIQHVTKGIKVLYTMIEGDTVPDSWRPYLSQADYIIVPSTFVKDTFARAGFESTVIPLGFDPSTFHNIERETNKVYTFLHYEAFQDRKGWQELLEAWVLSGLAEEENAKLILKTVKPLKEVYEKAYGGDIYCPDNVKIVCGELPHSCVADLLYEADCFVFPSRGEGFSLPPIEAMATGLPVILTVGHSHLDYFDPRYMYGVPCAVKIPARYSNWEDQGNFVRCVPRELGGVLRYVFEHQEIAFEKGLSSVEHVEKYVYSEFVRKLSDYLCQLQEKQVH